ncbi:hypothetical protein VNO77_34195 [Canavalia gladiata]|uniref:Uncharacterized protein n=1 Tax=Canavalia gladiata TaxID=3824 RepID=A0AAN9KEN5_CANGL
MPNARPSRDQNIFQPPAMVMSTAITPRNANAPLVIRVIDFKQFDTVTTIKSVYGVGKDWQGDPCGSVAYVWDGLNCTYNGNESPRITTLNLSSNGSSGKIDPSISKLNMISVTIVTGLLLRPSLLTVMWKPSFGSAHDHTGKKPELQNATNNRALHFLEDLLAIVLQARRRALGVLIPSSKKSIRDVQRSLLLQEPTERFLDFFSPLPEAANPS